jgi:catechol 2,3-dioxygenase-like lactoylglutathione lyase family enzyme
VTVTDPAGGVAASLDHLYMVVSDLDRSVAFYERLGFGVARWGDYVRLEGTNGMYIGMEQQRDDSRTGSSIELVVLVDDVDARFEALQAAGVTFDGRPQDQEWGARHVWLTDPDGNRLSLFSPIEGSA